MASFLYYKLYVSKCLKDRPDGAFYLKPLNNLREDCWFCKASIGHNALQHVVPNLFKEAEIAGHYTNCSLKVTSVTQLLEVHVDNS